MAEMVSQSIVDNRNADVSWFSILEDLSISIEKTYGFKSMDDSITN
jgi:hypothetical protein